MTHASVKSRDGADTTQATEDTEGGGGGGLGRVSGRGRGCLLPPLVFVCSSSL